ncbi:hypothetical protein SAMN05443429_11227 [Cruoricaptor ignavus]|uniref:Phage major capsid protein E n=1 Tax=Cruoricaptor ignavus TaxID=1118202 RepID=A0A1M6HDT3_9FLAO|nr:hypothetical protein [Cruoricaptor ignavus]SHJ20313.1 hypothetical protein SAMN05443429_11227 [Cruoricaptor ignavus]
MANTFEGNFRDQIVGMVSDLTSAEKMLFSEAIFTESVDVADIANDHTVITGVRHGSLVPIIDDQPDYQSFPFSDPNVCEIPECDSQLNFSTDRWDLGLIECKTSICLRSFSDEFLVFFRQWKMVQTDQPKNEEYMQSAIVEWMKRKFTTNYLAAQWRVAYFGDKSSNSRFFNGVDGWFTRAEAAGNTIAIAENKGATYAEQELSGERVYEILEQMYVRFYNESWMTDKPVEFRMTKKNAMALALYFNRLSDKSCCNGLQVIDPQKVAGAPAFDYERLTFHNIPIRVMGVWDEIINKTTELNSGWNGREITNANAARVNPNRILLTYKENLLIGTQETSNLNFFDMWYSRDDDKVYMKGGGYFGPAMPKKNNVLLAI